MAVLTVVALSAAILATTAGASQTHAAATARAGQRTADATALKQVPGTLPGVGLATLLSPAPATEKLEVGVGITRPNAAGEQKLFDQIYDSSSSLYHHFLSVKQFDSEFGVKPAMTAAVRSFLTSGGLSIDSASSGGDYFLATGTVAQLDSLFHVSIGDYSYKGVSFTANNTAPSVPANLAIDGVAGLENLTHFTLDAVKGKQLAKTASATQAVKTSRALLSTPTTTIPATTPTTSSLASSVTSSTGSTVGSLLGGTTLTDPVTGVTTNLGSPVSVSNEGTEQTYTPQDLWGFYNAPGASALTNASGFSDPSTVAKSKYTLGQGQIMGVFTEGEDSSVVRNLRLFETTLGLPKVPVRIVETEGGPDSAYSDNSGSVEWYLDSQSSTGMAPDAKQLDLFTAKTFQDADVAKEFDYWANDANGPREMNASFGECEENPTEPLTGPLANLPAGVALGGEMENIADPFLRQAALEGRTLFASAGDTGSGCPSVVAPVLGGGNGLAIQPVPFQNYPCVSDYVVCVGGTTPSSKGAGYPAATQRSNEQAWTFTGGGSSYFNPAPSYQSAVKNVDTDCVSNDLGTVTYTPGNAPLCRGVPDVSDMSGGGNDWFFFYTDGEPSIEGGTSLASPLMMGQWARTQAAASTATQNSGGLGFANPTFYKQAASADSCTSAPCTGTYARDFNDITQGEDAGDVVGGQLGLAGDTQTGVGLANGVYGAGPGWDYVSGWGSLNDSNFIQDVDGTTTAADAYTGAEQAAASVCTATMSSPSGNATDDVSYENDPGLDLTGATLSSSGSNIVATLTVPDLSSGLPATSVTGGRFVVAWEYNGTVYYADAEESPSGSFSYNAGNTGPAFTDGLPVDGTYDDTATVTGSADASTGTITITVPASDVGSPASGALLLDPQAFSQEEVAVLDLTVDSADTLRDWSTDDGQLDSIGVNVVMNGAASNSCSNALPKTSTTTAQAGVVSSSGATPGTSGSSSTQPGTTSGTSSTKQGTATSKYRRPTTAIRGRGLTRHLLKLNGTARAFDGHTIASVGIAVARTVTRTVKHRKVVECQFLTAKHRWTKAGSCAPRDYLKATGTSVWRFTVKMTFKPGIYWVWEHATDSKKVTTRNIAAKHVFFRLKG